MVETWMARRLLKLDFSFFSPFLFPTVVHEWSGLNNKYPLPL